MNNIPIMPNNFKGKNGKNCGYTKTAPRKWTKEEIEWVKEMIKNNYSIKEIATSIGRSEVSVSIKIKRLGKKENTYNKRHIQEKRKYNSIFVEKIKPKTVLDLYCGTSDFYKEYDTTTNDIDKTIPADYNEDAFKLMCKLYYEGKKYDLIDLDPFGSAYDCFDLAIKMAKKGLIITLGEMGHKRWKRLDFVRSHYDINDIEKFTIQNIVAYIQKIGTRNKKKLIPIFVKEWENIGRIYFKIEKTKITEQWEK